MALIHRDDQRFDRRLVEKFIKSDLIKKSDYTTYLKSLDDCAENADYIRWEDVMDSGKPSSNLDPSER